MRSAVPYVDCLQTCALQSCELYQRPIPNGQRPPVSDLGHPPELSFLTDQASFQLCLMTCSGLPAGCALLSFDPYQMPGIAAVPLLLPSVSDLDSPLDAPLLEAGPAFDTGFKGASYLMVHAGQLWSVQYK